MGQIGNWYKSLTWNTNMEHWIVDDTETRNGWMLYDESKGDDSHFINVQGPKELAQRVANGLNSNQSA